MGWWGAIGGCSAEWGALIVTACARGGNVVAFARSSSAGAISPRLKWQAMSKLQGTRAATSAASVLISAICA
eukprot:6054031-Lingulodinium_polyedra.AAC.1